MAKVLDLTLKSSKCQKEYRGRKKEYTLYRAEFRFRIYKQVVEYYIRVGENIDDEPADELPLPFEEEDDRLQTIHSTQHDQRNERRRGSFSGDRYYQIDEVDGCCR